jgi:hypothetical protein
MTTTPAEDSPSTPTAFAPPRTLSILSLVAAVAAIPLGHFLILPLAAIVLGFYGRTREPWARTLSTWGIVLGFVVLFWWVLVGIAALTFWAALPLLHWLH